jgi:hypothetical protein
LVGKCSWSRKYIDWELSSSLRNDSVNRRNGVLGIQLPSAVGAAVPDRLDDNWVRNEPDSSYALYKTYPSTAAGLRARIEEAFVARTEKASLADNSRALRTYNSTCD